MADFFSSIFENVCHDCVSEGCIYCAKDVNGNPDVCYCPSISNGYIGCVEVGIGYKPLESPFDCSFNSQHGEIFLGLASAASVIIVCCLAVHIRQCIVRCCCSRNQSSTASISSSSQRKRTRRPLYVKPRDSEVFAIPLEALKGEKELTVTSTIPYAVGTSSALSNVDSEFVQAEAQVINPSAPTYEDIENHALRISGTNSQNTAEVTRDSSDDAEIEAENKDRESKLKAENLSLEAENRTQHETHTSKAVDTGDVDMDMDVENEVKVLDPKIGGLDDAKDEPSEFNAQITAYSDGVEVEAQSYVEALDSKPRAITPP